MQLKTRQEAQKIILRRSGAIVIADGRSQVTELFQEKAESFAALKQQGLNYLQIERELSRGSKKH